MGKAVGCVVANNRIPAFAGVEFKLNDKLDDLAGISQKAHTHGNIIV